MRKKHLFILLSLICLLIIVSISLMVRDNFKDDNVIYDDDLFLDEVINITEDFDNKVVLEYIEKYNNQDVVGEISILNTDYKKAIMQYSDNDYYLNHTEDKTSSYMGSIYLDFRLDINNSKKLLIYGHNSGRISMPFEILEEYYDEDYYKEHKYIKITTDKMVKLYKIYSVFVEVEDFSYMNIDFEDENDWYNHINNFKSKSIYDTGEDIAIDDNILILQTCSTHYKYNSYDRKFLLVVAKEVK